MMGKAARITGQKIRKQVRANMRTVAAEFRGLVNRQSLRDRLTIAWRIIRARW